MPHKGLFQQNIIAVMWDFDKTLSPHYMQRPLFEEYGVDESTFWKEVAALPAYYARAGVRVQPDTCYLGHLLAYVRSGRMAGLTNAKLRELGGRIDFFEGIPEVFDSLSEVVQAPVFQEFDLHVEHYVVSTGLAELIRGSCIAGKLAGIHACEFIEEPAGPGEDLAGTPSSGTISHIASLLDHTTKTRVLFEVNKGVNKHAGITVNDTIPEEERRVPFKNMMYIADGPSDIPCFSVMRKNGAVAYAVYDPSAQEHFTQAVALHEQGRVNAFGPADYRPGTQTRMWLEYQVRRIAERIVSERRESFDGQVGRSPQHIDGAKKKD